MTQGASYFPPGPNFWAILLPPGAHRTFNGEVDPGVDGFELLCFQRPQPGHRSPPPLRVEAQAEDRLLRLRVSRARWSRSFTSSN